MPKRTRKQEETAAPDGDIPVLLTPQEVAERVGLSRRRVYDWLSWGWLRGHRHGGRWVVTGDDLDFFTHVCRGARGRLMPSLRDWGPIWDGHTPSGGANGARP